jgi:glutamine amidotransferase
MFRIAVIDYGMGNVRSVCNAIEAIGGESFVAQIPADLDNAGGIVLPGVGAFGDGMKNLRARGWDEALDQQVIELGKPFLGICLGMQLLAETGNEHGEHPGLGWLKGSVNRIPNGNGLRIPHIGWNDIELSKESSLFDGIDSGACFYFVHSFIFCPSDDSITIARCDYGSKFAAAINRDNIFATQFHPEKSQKAGLILLRNFLGQVK